MNKERNLSTLRDSCVKYVPHGTVKILILRPFFRTKIPKYGERRLEEASVTFSNRKKEKMNTNYHNNF